MWRRALVLTALTVLAAPGTVARAFVVQSHFDAGLDGWTLTGDPPPGPLLAPVAGGNPGGYAQALDGATGAELYWVAPAEYLGEPRGLLGGTLAFDRISDHASDLTPSADVVLVGRDGTVLTHSDTDDRDRPTLQWSRTAVQLAPAASWTDRTGVQAGDDEFSDVLAHPAGVRSAARYSDAPATDGLDNVLLAYTATLPAASDAIGLPPVRRPCRPRVALRIHFHTAPGVEYVAARIRVGRRVVRRLSRRRLSSPVDIGPLPPDTSTLRVSIETFDGRTILIHRTYRTCRS